MRILSDVYARIIQCPSVPPERGGILGMKNDVVCSCVFDTSLSPTNSAVYIPNVDFLNTKICEWEQKGIAFSGIFHSHPANQPELSSDDIEYIKVIFQSMPTTIKTLYFPIVLPNVALVSFKAIYKKDAVHILEDKIKII